LTLGAKLEATPMDKAEAAAVVTTRGWLSRRPPAFQAAVIARCRLRTFDAGESLYNPGDPADGMFGLVHGQLLTRVPPADVLADVEQPGYWIGEATAFQRSPRWVTVAAGTRVTVLHLPQTAFDDLARDAENCRHFAINGSETLSLAATVIANLIQPVPEIRIAQRLLSFTGLFEGSYLRTFDFSQTELATMCGLSRQTTNKVLRQFVERGLIAITYRRIDIVDFAALRALAIDDDRIWR
jgi:CRP-like cAMP-binding protein